MADAKLGPILRAARGDLSFARAGELAGISASRWRQLESGKGTSTRPKPETLDQIAAAFGLELRELLTAAGIDIPEEKIVDIISRRGSQYEPVDLSGLDADDVDRLRNFADALRRSHRPN